MTSVLSLVIDILTVGAGVLGIVGITVVGVKYMSAGGNEVKVKKTKQQFYEIMIGLLVFGALTVVLKWVQMLFMG